MHIGKRLLSYQFDMSVTRRQKVKGVNSRLVDGKHFLMWDFDNVPQRDMISALDDVQVHFQLPDIHILQSSFPGYYHAYCFDRHSWANTVHIVMTTEHVDKQFIKLGVFREYLTLRFSEKPNTNITRLVTLEGFADETVRPSEATSFESYFAKVRT